MSRELEASLIGSLLLDRDRIKEVYDFLKPEMFTSKISREVYSQIITSYEMGEDVDIVLISEKCANRDVDSETYKRYMADCYMDVPTSNNAKKYAEGIAEVYRSNKLIEVLGRVNTEPNMVNDSIAELMVQLEDLQSNKKHTCKSMKQITEECQGMYFVDTPKKLVYTGFAKMDECLGGLRGSSTITIGSRPATGKSALAIQIAKNVAMQGKKVYYANLEMSDSDIYERLLASFSEVDMSRIQRATTYLGDEKEKIFTANKIIADLPITVSTGAKTEVDIMSETRYGDYDLIIIDYLQLLNSSKRCESRRVEVGYISRYLKMLAMDLDIPIIMLSQLNRNVEHTQTKEPTMADLRETGDIEQDSSVVALLWNLSDDPKLREYKGFKVCKNRFGELFEENLVFVGRYATFGENTKESLENVKSSLSNIEKNIANGDMPF